MSTVRTARIERFDQGLPDFGPGVTWGDLDLPFHILANTSGDIRMEVVADDVTVSPLAPADRRIVDDRYRFGRTTQRRRQSKPLDRKQLAYVGWLRSRIDQGWQVNRNADGSIVSISLHDDDLIVGAAVVYKYAASMIEEHLA